MLLVVLIVCIVLFVVLPFIQTTLLAVVSTVLIALVVGALARVIAPGAGRVGIVLTGLVGLAGSLAGTVVARGMHTGGFGRLLLQVGAAVALLVVLRPIRSRKVKA